MAKGLNKRLVKTTRANIQVTEDLESLHFYYRKGTLTSTVNTIISEHALVLEENVKQWKEIQFLKNMLKMK